MGTAKAGDHRLRFVFVFVIVIVVFVRAYLHQREAKHELLFIVIFFIIIFIVIVIVFFDASTFILFDCIVGSVVVWFSQGGRRR